MRKNAMVPLPFFWAARLTALCFGATNAIFHAMGRYARRRGMTADDVAAEWSLSLIAAKNLLEGRDFAEVRENQ